MTAAHLNPFADDPLPPELAVDEEPLSEPAIDFHAGVGAEEAEPLRPRWDVADDDVAEWALRKLGNAQRAEAQLRTQRDAWTDRISHWFDQASRPHAQRAAFFEGALKDYLRRRREADPKLNSIPLPSGRVASKAEPAKVVVAHEATVLDWIEDVLDREQRETVVRREVKVSELRKLVEIQREVLGTRYLLELECGHTQAWGTVLDETEAPDLGDAIQCFPCTEETGLPAARTITTLETQEVVETTVVARGEPVPGVDVQPAGRSVWVSLS